MAVGSSLGPEAMRWKDSRGSARGCGEGGLEIAAGAARVSRPPQQRPCAQSCAPKGPGPGQAAMLGLRLRRAGLETGSRPARGPGPASAPSPPRAHGVKSLPAPLRSELFSKEAENGSLVTNMAPGHWVMRALFSLPRSTKGPFVPLPGPRPPGSLLPAARPTGTPGPRGCPGPGRGARPLPRGVRGREGPRRRGGHFASGHVPRARGWGGPRPGRGPRPDASRHGPGRLPTRHVAWSATASQAGVPPGLPEGRPRPAGKCPTQHPGGQVRPWTGRGLRRSGLSRKETPARALTPGKRGGGSGPPEKA